MSSFAGIENAKSNQGGNYVLPGIYPLLYINALKKIRSQESNDEMVIAEIDILESRVEDRPRGSSMSWIVNLKHQPALGNIKAFLAALLCIDESQVDARGADYAVSAENPLRGRLIRCEAVEITTKKTKQPFTKCNWSSIPAEIQAQSAELHAAAGFTAF